jgi:hypothetical protein
MKSPADMKVIMIDVTNACSFACSNCTRFCGQHPRPFFMDMGTFERAVDSMAGFKGIVGIIGGEPTLHPQFAELVDYYERKIPEPRPRTFIRPPVKSFIEYGRTVKYQRGRRRGLFSSLGSGYYKHFEQIQDVFPYQSLNDHQSCNTHQAILVTRKELGIPDDEWVRLRDRCWIQNLWSASITPKGAFFCEIAAALDTLFDGPGGWPIEPGWWKRRPKDFEDQLHWCEMCSVPCKVPTMDASRETDIVSPVMLEKLKKVNGPKIRNGRFVVLDPSTYDPGQHAAHGENRIWYLPSEKGDDARVAIDHGTLYPRKIDVAVLRGESARATLAPERVSALEFTDWVAVFPEAEKVNGEFLERAGRCIFNPGCFYESAGEVRLFNRRARALRGVPAIALEAGLRERWERRKRVELRTYPKVGELTAREKLSMLLGRAQNRGAFILPETLGG